MMSCIVWWRMGSISECGCSLASLDGWRMSALDLASFKCVEVRLMDMDDVVNAF